MTKSPSSKKQAPIGVPTEEQITELEDMFKGVQDHICFFLEKATGQRFEETEWNYDNGNGGGRTRVWEVNRRKYVDDASWSLVEQEHPLPFFEKGACNLSIIEGFDLPESAAEQLKIPKGKAYKAMGVSLIFHPSNPWVPTTHANVRFFFCDGKWWFGGGVDVTPYYPRLDQAMEFHKQLEQFCGEHDVSYEAMKDKCDKYFYLSHRKEERGIGGIFFDHMHGDGFEHARDFTIALGKKFTDLYAPFLENATRPFTSMQREFQLYRRGRYVEFNLLFDRGTKFGISSDGRAESILCSLPSTVHWQAGYTPTKGSKEAYLYDFFLQPQDYANLTEEEILSMAPSEGYLAPTTSSVKTEVSKGVLRSCCGGCHGCSSTCSVAHVVVLGLVAYAAYMYFKKK
eukprot:m.12833 g.12833  ORF g.12833 m.12833 type:complete len:399 (+) comp4069_c0_seq1:221-1417(+)